MQAVSTEIDGADFAMAACEIDFAGHTAAYERCVVGFVDHADKLVAGNACKRMIAALKFEIGVADPGSEHADECKLRRPCRNGHLTNCNFAGIEMGGNHAVPILTR